MTGAVALDDGRSDIWTTPNIVSLSCRDFVRFKPEGGIWVTLGIATWDTVGIAEWSYLTGWEVTTDATSGPEGPDSSDELPVWLINQRGAN